MRYCAQLPEPDCKSGRVAHKVWRPEAVRPACREGGMASSETCFRRPGGIIYQFIRSIGGISHRHVAGRDPTAKPLAAGGHLCATAPSYRSLIENQAA